MPWILAGAALVLVAAGVLWSRSRRTAGARRCVPSLAELESERERLVAEREAAKERGDREVVEELTLQIRTREHWINKAKRKDDGWREYYEKTSGKLLDEWGKTGSK